MTLFLFFLPFLSFHRSSSPSVSSSVSFSSPPPLLYENYSYMGCWQIFFGPIFCLWQREKKVEANPQIRDRPPVRTELSTLRGEFGRADGSRAVKGRERLKLWFEIRGERRVSWSSGVDCGTDCRR